MFTNEEITEIVSSQLDSLIWSEGELVNESGEFTGEMWGDFYEHWNATPELDNRLVEELQQWKDVEFYGRDAYDSMVNAVATYCEHFGESWAESFGHDIALTRNGHGAGFWDRGLGVVGDVLTDWAKSLGTLHIFHGHDSIHPEKWAGMFHAE